MDCKPALFHYNGYCFNKQRVPEGQVALSVHECEILDKEVKATIIR